MATLNVTPAHGATTGEATLPTVVPVGHLSYSSIALYGDCARAWWHRYVQRAPEPGAPALTFGSALHGVFERWLRANAAGERFDAVSTWSTLWNDAADNDAILWGDDDPDDLHDTGVAILRHPAVVEHVGGLQPLLIGGVPAVEHRIELRVPGVPVPVVGVVDCIAADGTIVDFKTANRPWTPDRAANELQPAFYLAAQSQLGLAHLNPERRFRHLVVTKSSRPRVDVYETTRDAADLFAALLLAQRVWRGIAASSFDINPGAWRCSPRFCSYWTQCIGKDSPDELLGL